MSGLGWIEQVQNSSIEAVLQQEQEYRESDRLSNSIYAEIMRMDLYKAKTRDKATKKGHTYLVAFIEDADHLQLQGLGATIVHSQGHCLAIYPVSKAPYFMCENYNHKEDRNYPLEVIGVKSLQEVR